MMITEIGSVNAENVQSDVFGRGQIDIQTKNDQQILVVMKIKGAPHVRQITVLTRDAALKLIGLLVNAVDRLEQPGV